MSQAGAGSLSRSNDPPPRPAVVPRARQPSRSSSIPIDRLVLPFISAHTSGLICIAAAPGGGKTTALQYLREVLSAFLHVRFFDSNQPEDARRGAQSSLSILTSDVLDPAIDVLAVFELCAWTLDDCMEYLSARHRDQIASVLVNFLLLQASGRLPAPFAPVAGWDDIVAGLAAIPLAWMVQRQTTGWRTVLIAWNLFGMADERWGDHRAMTMAAKWTSFLPLAPRSAGVLRDSVRCDCVKFLSRMPVGPPTSKRPPVRRQPP